MTNINIGIDIGGTNTKIGLVDFKGNLFNKHKVSTQSLIENGDYIKGFKKFLNYYLLTCPIVDQIGIGIPGVLNKDRDTTLEIANIPQLDNKPFLKELVKDFPSKKFYLENDANVAAWGEYRFGLNKKEKNFILITLGTGVGSSAIIDGQIFKGGQGNAMEIGHTLIDKTSTLEENIGKPAIVEKARGLIPIYKDQTKLVLDNLNFKMILNAFIRDEDPLAKQLFKDAAELLGGSIVNIIRLLDVKTIIIGGGWSSIFSTLKDDIYRLCQNYLTSYYVESLIITRAKLRNEAGIIGAAGLNQS